MTSLLFVLFMGVPHVEAKATRPGVAVIADKDKGKDHEKEKGRDPAGEKSNGGKGDGGGHRDPGKEAH